MSTIELKEYLKAKIDETNDEAQLQAISSMIATNAKILENYNVDLDKAERDIQEGNFQTNDSVNDERKKWLH